MAYWVSGTGCEYIVTSIASTDDVMMVLQNQSLQAVTQQLNETVGSWQTYYYEVFDIMLSIILLTYDEKYPV